MREILGMILRWELSEIYCVLACFDPYCDGKSLPVNVVGAFYESIVTFSLFFGGVVNSIYLKCFT